MNILVIDIGGTNVKVWKTGESDMEKFTSGKNLTPKRLLEQVQSFVGEWKYDRVSIGYPGVITNGRPVAEPINLGSGWTEFDWSLAFHEPLRMMNDACMQALGSYEGGKMLYLGLGTGIGTTFITEGVIVPLALGHLQFEDSTLDSLLNRDALKRNGSKKWREAVFGVGASLKQAFMADYVVYGGGNAKKLDELPEGCRRGGNHNAYFGGLRLWDDVQVGEKPKLALYPKTEQPPVATEAAEQPAEGERAAVPG